MPRDADIAVNQNATAQPGNVNNTALAVEAQPITVHNTVQSSGASQKAEQLANALGVATKQTSEFVNAGDTIDKANATADAAEGISKPTGSALYKATQDHVHALASWAVDGDQIAQDAQHQGFAQNPDSKQGLTDMNNWLNQQYQSRYAGMSKASMSILAPEMSKLRDKLNTDFQNQKLDQMNEKQQGDLATVAGKGLAAAFSPTLGADGKPITDKNGVPIDGGTFDPSKYNYEAINQLNQGLYPGKDGNQLTFSQVANFAISHGVPSALESMPTKWADGTPSPAGSGDPRMVTQFREAVKQAKAQQERNLNEADVTNKDQQHQIAEAQLKDAYTQIAGGKQFSLEDFKSKLEGLPGVSAHDYMTLWDQNQSYGTHQAKLNLEALQTTEGLQEYGAKYNSIKSQIILGSANFQTIPQVLDQIHQAGYVGTTADKMLAKLSPVVEAAGNNVLKNPEDQARLAQIKSVYNPGNYDSISKKFDNERNNASREAALQAYHQARSAGQEPDDANKAADTAAENAGKIYDTTQGKQGQQTRSSAEAYHDTAVTLIPTTAIRTALQSNDTKALRSFGLTPTELSRRMAARELTPDETLAIRNKLK